MEAHGMTTFTRRAVEILVEEWERWWSAKPRPKGYLESGVIYERLVAEGWDVPDYVLDKLWERLRAEEQIKGPGLQGKDGWRMHGNRTFMGVNPHILDDTAYLERDDYRLL